MGLKGQQNAFLINSNMDFCFPFTLICRIGSKLIRQRVSPFLTGWLTIILDLVAMTVQPGGLNIQQKPGWCNNCQTI